jgi:hypothetical protein
VLTIGDAVAATALERPDIVMPELAPSRIEDQNAA